MTIGCLRTPGTADGRCHLADFCLTHKGALNDQALLSLDPRLIFLKKKSYL